MTNRLVFGGDPWAHVPPDGGWPLALYPTILWPMAIAPGYLIGSWIARATGHPLRGVVLLTVVFTRCITLAIGMYDASPVC